MNDQPYWMRELFADLDGLVDVWAGFRARHIDGDPMATPVFAAGLEECAAQLRAAVARARQLRDDEAAANV